jgi:alpha-1,2-mannosyltransferase
VVMIVAIALVVRGRPLVELDRFGLMGYDQAAYFAGGRALTRGYLPYKDFVHLQPPGVLVALAPFALIGSWGFTLAKALVVGLGAASTALVWRITRSWVGPIGAVVAAIAYALNRSSVGAHRYVLIDPFVTVWLLAAITLYARQRSDPRSPRREIVVGVLLGLAVGFKLSALVAVGAFFVAMAVRERRAARPARVACGVGLGLVATIGPFALFAPGSLLDQVVWSQAGRNRSVGAVDRLLSSFWFAGKPPEEHKALAVACVVIAVVILVWWGARSRSFLGVLAATWLAVGTGFVLAAPQFYEHYGELLAPPLALLMGGFVTSSISTRWSRPVRFLPWAAGGLAAAVVIGGGLSTALRPLPPPFLHAAGEYQENTRTARRTVPADECVITDSPEIALALPSGFGYSVTGDAPTVDPFATAVVADTEPPVPPVSLARFEHSMARCPWFATPRYWSPRVHYPGWSDEMQARFIREHELVSTTPGMELWRSVRVAPERDPQP